MLIFLEFVNECLIYLRILECMDVLLNCVFVILCSDYVFSLV